MIHSLITVAACTTRLERWLAPVATNSPASDEAKSIADADSRESSPFGDSL